MLQAALSNTLVHNSLWQLGNNNMKNRGGEKKTKTLPQLFGIVLLNLCPLLRKFHILLYQLQARLCVLFNDVILVLVEGAQHK